MSVAGDGVSAQGVDDVATLHYLREATQSQERLSEGRSFSHQLLYVCMAVIAAVEDFIISRDRREDGSSRSENSGAGGSN